MLILYNVGWERLSFLVEIGLCRDRVRNFHYVQSSSKNNRYKQVLLTFLMSLFLLNNRKKRACNIKTHDSKNFSLEQMQSNNLCIPNNIKIVIFF